jgi:hypothetical protein
LETKRFPFDQKDKMSLEHLGPTGFGQSREEKISDEIRGVVSYAPESYQDEQGETSLENSQTQPQPEIVIVPSIQKIRPVKDSNLLEIHAHSFHGEDLSWTASDLVRIDFLPHYQASQIESVDLRKFTLSWIPPHFEETESATWFDFLSDVLFPQVKQLIPLWVGHGYSEHNPILNFFFGEDGVLIGDLSSGESLRAAAEKKPETVVFIESRYEGNAFILQYFR